MYVLHQVKFGWTASLDAGSKVNVADVRRTAASLRSRAQQMQPADSTESLGGKNTVFASSAKYIVLDRALGIYC